MKLWHLFLKAPSGDDRRREVSHEAEGAWTDDAFAEYLLPLGLLSFSLGWLYDASWTLGQKAYRKDPVKWSKKKKYSTAFCGAHLGGVYL